MDHVQLVVNEDEVADYKWVNSEEFATSMKHKMSYLRALSTVFPSYLLVKNNLGYGKEHEYQKIGSNTDVRKQSF